MMERDERATILVATTVTKRPQIPQCSTFRANGATMAARDIV